MLRSPLTPHAPPPFYAPPSYPKIQPRALPPLPHLSLLDVMFSYTTPKIVRVMDARLGLFKKFAQVIIVIYIIVYKLIGDLGYIKFETVRWRAASPLSPSSPSGIRPSRMKPGTYPTWVSYYE